MAFSQHTILRPYSGPTSVKMAYFMTNDDENASGRALTCSLALACPSCRWARGIHWLINTFIRHSHNWPALYFMERNLQHRTGAFIEHVKWTLLHHRLFGRYHTWSVEVSWVKLITDFASRGCVMREKSTNTRPRQATLGWNMFILWSPYLARTTELVGDFIGWAWIQSFVKRAARGTASRHWRNQQQRALVRKDAVNKHQKHQRVLHQTWPASVILIANQTCFENWVYCLQLGTSRDRVF